MANLYEVLWKDHEDHTAQKELIEADLVEHAGNLLIFAQLISVPVSAQPIVGKRKKLEEVNEDDLSPDDLVGADPYEELFRRKAKSNEQQVPHVIFMIPVQRVVTIRKVKQMTNTH